MFSRRRYAPRNCKNPACASVFIPHDKRQEYCDAQCRVNANNDRRNFDNATRFDIEKVFRHNCSVLKFFWLERAAMDPRLVTKDELIFYGFDFSASTQTTVDKRINEPILWCHDYGYGKFALVEKLFVLYKRPY